MIYQVDRIVRDVRVALDQDRTSEALFSDGDIDSLKLDELIASKILEGVERVHMTAPYPLLEQGHNFEYDNNGLDDDNDEVIDNEEIGIYWEGTDDTCGWLPLPEDFMRLVVFEMTDWERPVYTPITTSDPRYARQRGRVKGLRGTAQRPVCVIAVRPEGKVLEFYSCKSRNALVKKAVYMPYPKIVSVGEPGSEVDSVDVSVRCYTAVVYMIAGLATAACNEPERAKTYFELANTYLNK